VLVPIFRRVALAWWFFAAAAVLDAVVFTPIVRGWGVPRSLSSFVAIVMCSLLGAPYYNLWRYSSTSDWTEARTTGPLFSAVVTAISTTLVLRILHRSPPWGLWVDAVIVAASAVAMWLAARHLRRALADRVLRVSDPDHAESLVIRCEEELRAEGLAPSRRAALRVSHAHALVVASARPGLAFLLLEAFDELHDTLDEAEPQDVLAVAVQIVEALDSKHDLAGETLGIDDAIELMMDAAWFSAQADPTAMARAHLAVGRCRLRQSRRVVGDEHEAGVLREQALLAFQRAIDAAPQTSDQHALATLALIEADLPQDLDQAIARCRRALRRLWLFGVEARASGFLVLADLLERRADVAPSGRHSRPDDPRAWCDLLRALRLCLRLRRGEHRIAARERIPRLLHELGVTGFPMAGPRLQTSVYRRVVDGARADAPASAARSAEAWAAAAMSRGDARTAAEAWHMWLTITVTELQRRVLQDRQLRLPAVQRRVAVAAEWMVRAGRARDAALSLEAGRAVLLTDRMRRRRLAIADRLRDAGRDDLAAEWELISDALDAEDRAGGDRSRSESDGYGSVEFMALVERERLLDDLRELEGFDDVDPAPRFEDLVAASASGPLVYLAAGDEQGFAVAVSDPAHEPTAVVLPLLTHAAVTRVADRLRDAAAPFEVARELRRTLPWLWDSALAPLQELLAPDAQVTLVAFGVLAELPLHAAACAPDDDGVWRDRVPGLVLRYAPNARMLRSSQDIVTELPTAAPWVLSVAVPDVRGRRRLDFARAESAALGSVFGDRLRRPVAATVAEVSSLLDACPIWHFACHGDHDPDDPLASSLALEDGPLTLGAILARPGGRQRLAVLSACQTARIGDRAPDEVVGFPAAMLQAGVAGVVSCLGEVEDDAAMLLVLRFASHVADGVPGPRALALAQAWLRGSTNQDLHGQFPEAYPRPARADGEWERDRRFAAPSTWALFNYTGA
jgi:CHAT domain-containing protein